MTERTPRTTQRAKRSGPEPKTDWYDAFLEALRSLPVVRTACREARVGRSTAYEARQRDEAFALAWADAIREGAENFEEIAHVRAGPGQPTKKTVTKTSANGDVETTVTEERHVSDTVLLAVLRRHKPEYRESQQFEHSGPAGGPIQHEVDVTGALDELDAELDRLNAAG